MNHTEIIKRFAVLRRPRTYLEIGYGFHGENFHAIPSEVKHAVDPFVKGNPDVAEKTSDRFFLEAHRHQRKIRSDLHRRPTHPGAGGAGL